MEVFSTAAGHSLKTIKETPSTMMNGINHDLRGLSNNVSVNRTLELTGNRQSVPRVKLVQVSPKLSMKNFKGL
jgi:hypothetical protein